MIYKEMREDFRFMFPYKKDIVYNWGLNPVREFSEIIQGIRHEYCLNCYDEDLKTDIDLIRVIDNGEYPKIIDGVMSVGFGEKTIRQLNEVFRVKERMYNSIMKYHKNILKLNKKVVFLCFSLSVNRGHQFRGNESPENINAYNEILNKFRSEFFNNIRSRAFFKKNIIGRFWVSLQETGGKYMYIHINFYLKNRQYNYLLGREINSVWFGILGKNKVTGQAIHFTITESYENSRANNNAKRKKKIIYKVSERFDSGDKTRKVMDIYPDLNGGNQGAEYSFTNDPSHIPFSSYVKSLVKKAFHISGMRSFGTASLQTEQKASAESGTAQIQKK
ncbi:hypothetical protein [Morganella morganii]|uniref:hypothetical protein n=1 Tax=Morganella morganii TaxID=582 RepID=UPI001891E71D|nr:hypothetical protein [Morganella morganii]HDU8496042.1 hypothetical protein [Morganella morganii]